MPNVDGKIAERMLNGSGRILCTASAVPRPGQYVAACAPDLAPVLATPIFLAGELVDGFVAAPILPADWMPGVRLNLRGPIGRGFEMPGSARRVALVANGTGPERLLSLVGPALAQGASVVLVSDRAGEDVPPDVEIQPSSALVEVYKWAEYAALDVDRDDLSRLHATLGNPRAHPGAHAGEVLVRAPMPCVAMADCGVCAVRGRKGWNMACKDGPVFKLAELFPD